MFQVGAIKAKALILVAMIECAKVWKVCKHNFLVIIVHEIY